MSDVTVRLNGPQRFHVGGSAGVSSTLFGDEAVAEMRHSAPETTLVDHLEAETRLRGQGRPLVGWAPDLGELLHGGGVSLSRTVAVPHRHDLVHASAE